MVILDHIKDHVKKKRAWFRQKGEPQVSHHLTENTIAFLDAKDRNDALEHLVQTLYQSGKIQNPATFYHAILGREKIVSTGIGMGVAIPHAKIPGVSSFSIALGIQKGAGIEWKSLDRAPVRLIFMIVGPDNEQEKYLGILSMVTDLVRNETLRATLPTMKSASQVCRLLVKHEMSKDLQLSHFRCDY